MKIRKRCILLILLSILPFYKIIHFGDYCINDEDYLVVAFLSILVLVTFLQSFFLICIKFLFIDSFLTIDLC